MRISPYACGRGGGVAVMRTPLHGRRQREFTVEAVFGGQGRIISRVEKLA